MNLNDLRQQIDSIDEQIIKLIGQRLNVVDDIGRLKQSQGLTVRDSARFETLLHKLKSIAKSRDIPADLVEKIYHEIHEAAIARQRSGTIQ